MKGVSADVRRPGLRSEEDKMPRRLSVIAACALALVIFASAHAQGSPSSAPSLGDLARQAQKDKDNDNASKPAAKVLTNDDLATSSGGASGGLDGALGQVAQPAAGSNSGAAPSPAEKLAKMEALLDQVATVDRASLVRTALEGKDTDFPGRAKWEERLLAARQSYVAQARGEVQRARQIVATADTLKGVQDPNDPRVKDLKASLQGLVRDAVQTESAFQAVMIEGRDLAAQAAAH
jgi:hypothetical protein